MASIRAAPDERAVSLGAGLGQFPRPRHRRPRPSASRRWSPSTTPTIWSRSTPAVGLRFETRQLGTRRLGASFEWSWFDPDWRTRHVRPRSRSTRDIPPAYDTRSTITPLLKFAFTPELSVAAGVSISELEPLAPGDRLADGQRGGRPRSTTTSDGWTAASGPTTSTRASACAPAPGSSRAISPTRGTSARARYDRYDQGRHHVEATGMAGGITGHAPLFERFTLGDSRTLRGWDKYDIAPAGGDRMFHSSVEYRYTGIGALPRRRLGVGCGHRTARPRIDGLRLPRRPGVLLSSAFRSTPTT